MRALLACCIAVATLANATAAEPAPAIIGVKDIKAGMKGYGLTVFHGMTPERFDVYVVGVLRNFLPKEDVILIRSDDERLKHSGVVAGMSGSPIYFEGKLAGALAYGWNFAKDPIAGVTPIESMLADLHRPLRGRALTPTAQASREVLPGQLVRAAVPLSISGLQPQVLREFTELMAPYDLVPMQAGGSGDDKRPSERFVPGGSIAVELVRGDISMVGTGTVTTVIGDKVLAFGHPMFNIGELYLPIANAEIHTFMSSLNSSFKMASPLGVAGALEQDRQSGIYGDMSKRVDMIPITIELQGTGRNDHKFSVEVARHRFLTPMLAATVIANAVQTAASDVADATISVAAEIDVHGYPPLRVEDFFFAPDGLSPRVVASSTGVRALSELLFNPFGPVRIDRIAMKVSVDYRRKGVDLVGIALSADELNPGSRSNLTLQFRPQAGAEFTQTVPLEIPASLAGQSVKVSVASGAQTKPELAPPETVAEVIDNLRKSYSAESIVVSVETPDEGLLLHGHVVPSLPSSVMDTLRPSAESRKAESFHSQVRTIVQESDVVQGKQELTVHVREIAK